MIITVGLPFYHKTNVKQFSAAIDSILNQSYFPDEIHLIQDGPISDELSTLVSTYLTKYPQTRHIIISKNSGLSHALNLSILLSNSKYYVRMDADDISYPNRLEKQIGFLESNPEIEILGSWATEFQIDPIHEKGNLRKVPTCQKEIKQFFHYRNPFIHPTVVFRRKIFATIGLYNPAFQMEEDLELWSRVLKMDIRVANLPEPLLYYRFTDSINRRASAISFQIKARYKFNTWSIRLNFLKLLSILMRLLPISIQKKAYTHLR